MKKEFQVEFAGSSYPAFYITEREQANRAILKMMESSSVLAADCETAALPQYRHIPDAALSPHLARPRLFQMFTGKGAVVIDLFKTQELPLLGKLFSTRPSVFHNMSFDASFIMKHFNVENPAKIHCTAIAARCCFQAMYSEFKSASLKDVATAIFKTDVVKKLGNSDWSEPELTFEQILYAATDCVIQMRVYEKLSEWIDKLGLRKVYELYIRAQIVICKMQLLGINFDTEKHKTNIAKWREDLTLARAELEELTGLQVITDTKIGDFLKTNLPKNVLDIWPVLEKSKRLSTDANTLVDFGHIEIVKPFSRYQKAKKLTTSFGTNLFNFINPATGRVHVNFRIAGAVTGRLSCSNFNIQQSPRDKDFRSTIIPTKGYRMVVIDYSSIEVRVIAELSNDKKLLEAYAKGLDVYKFTAAHLNDIPMSQVTKEQRQAAKALQLGLLYGLGAKKFSHYAKKNYGVDISQEQAYEEVEKFRQLYPELRAWQLQQVTMCQARRYTAFTKLGKSRKMTEDTYFGGCLNMPVQGLAAEIILLALIYVDEGLRGTSGRLLSCVHDELVCEALPEDVEIVKKVLTEGCIKSYNELLPGGRTLKNLVDPHSGLNWSEAKQ